jgi:hypothetical protein
VENFGWNLSANDYSVPEGVVLSSAAMVTAAETVQNAGLAGVKLRRGISRIGGARSVAREILASIRGRRVSNFSTSGLPCQILSASEILPSA